MESEPVRDVIVEDIAAEKRNALVGGPFGSNLVSRDYVESGVPVIRGQNMGSGRWLCGEFAYVSEEKAESLSANLARPGDVVFTQRGTLGQVAIVPDDGPHEKYVISQSQMKLSPDLAKVDPLYLYYEFTGPHQLAYIANNAIQTGVPHTNLTILRNTPLTLPPLTEQKAIAHILGTLDDKIELNRRMNATLEGMAQALFKSWFVDFDPVIDNAIKAGNPIPDEFADRAEVRRQALANGTANREAAKAFPAGFQETESMGWIPKGWEVGQLVENVRLTMGQSPSSDHYNKDGNGLPFHQGVTNYGERFPKHEQYSTGGNRYAEEGDILLSVRAPVGRINIANCRLIIGRGLSALRHKKDYQGLLVYFLKHTFATEDSIGSGTIFNAVNKKEMERIALIISPDQIAKSFNDIATSLDEKIASNAEQTDCLTKLRDTLLPKLISGELRIPEAEQLTNEALS
tara:strand:- start:6270 stop:7646 length:1377 start_codon:yes stop_codon:yes gene_type:complete